MSKNDQSDGKKKESPEQKMNRLKDEIIDEAKEIADGNQLSCYNLVMKTKELQAIEERS